MGLGVAWGAPPAGVGRAGPRRGGRGRVDRLGVAAGALDQLLQLGRQLDLGGRGGVALRGPGLGGRRARHRRVRRVDARLVRAQPRVAVAEELLVGGVARRLVAVGAALRHRRAHPQLVADGVEAVGGHRLPEEVVDQRLEAGEPAARGVGRGVRGGGRGQRGARVVVHRAAAVVQALQGLAQRLDGAGRLAGQCAQGGQLPAALAEALGGRDGRLSEPAQRGPGRLGERAQALEQRGGGRRRPLEVARQRRALPGQVRQLRHGGPQLGQEAGQPAHALAQLGPARRAGLGRAARLADEVGHVAAALVQARDHGVRVGDELLDRLVLVAQDPQRLAGLAQAGERAPQHRLDVLGAAGQAGAQRGHEQAQPLARGAAQHVVDQVLRDRALGRRSGTTSLSVSRSRDEPGWQST